MKRTTALLAVAAGVGLMGLSAAIDTAEAASRNSAAAACRARATKSYPHAHAPGAERGRTAIYTSCMRSKGFRP